MITSSDNRNMDFDYLKFCRLGLTGSEKGQVPTVLKNYLPSATSSAATEVSAEFFRHMWDRLGAYMIGLVEYLDASGFSIAMLADPDLCEPIYRYIQFAELRAWLAKQINAPGDHPYRCFEFLCGMIGKLSIVDPFQDRLVNYATYDHDDPYKSLNWAWGLIERQFVKPSELKVRRIPFIAERMQTEAGQEVVMKATLTPDLFESNWDLYLAFDTHYGKMTDEDRKQFFKVFRNGAVFYWKLGSQEFINQYFTSPQRGVDWKNPTRTKPGLGRNGDWYYADIVKDKYWDPVKQSGTICLRIDQNCLRTPATDLGTERITVGISERTYQYRVSIFAVRKDRD